MSRAESPASTAADITADAIALDERYGAPNYHPIPVVAASADGVWITDVEGRRLMDLLSAYSALNFGHRHPALLEAAHSQLERLTLTSRAIHNDQFGPFAAELADVCGLEMVLPMNTGAEAVETALKAARKWGYEVKGVRPGHAKIVVCDNNFHGRTTTIISFSSDQAARGGFGPFTPGFISVPFGDIDALAEALADEHVVAFLVEPVQGEAGVIVPPPGYLSRARELCSSHDVLLLADEIQTGFGRTGETFACQHESVTPDVYILGKALGGGIVPLSAIVSRPDVLGVLTPGTHGSTFGGNPLACAVGRAVLRLVRSGEYERRSRILGERLLRSLREADIEAVTEVRGIGLWAGVDLRPEAGPARAYCERLLDRGIIVKDTRPQTIRLAPPLVISEQELDWAIGQIAEVLAGAPA